MQWFDSLNEFLEGLSLYKVTLNVGDVLEILIIAILLYYILVWMKTTRAWSLMKGIVMIGTFLIIADLFHMNTILWIARNVLGFAVTALIVVLQPELRKALEELGSKSLWNVIPFETTKSDSMVSDKTINEIVKGCVEMGRAKTGALIVIEQEITLKEYEKTGIEVDGVVTSQLLINIFEHNTPLHDGAVLVRGNRVVSATCYLPLSDNLGLSKELGTRHRAGVGISEETDSLTVIVSEETGKISVAYNGELDRNLDAEELRKYMRKILIKEVEDNKRKYKWMGRGKAKE